jgi:competence protein ComEA
MKGKIWAVMSLVVAMLVTFCLVMPGYAATKEEPKKDAATKEPSKKDDKKKSDEKKDEKKKEASAKTVDLNNATQKEIESLKGIGPAKAKKIIANRPYKSVDDLSKAGLSKKEIDALKSSVVVGSAPAAKADAKAQPAPAAKAPEKAAPPAPEAKPAKEAKADKEPRKEQKSKLAPGQKINLNTASQADLELLPEIGPAKAKAIIAGRPYSKPEDVMKVKGIKQKTYDQIKDHIVVK